MSFQPSILVCASVPRKAWVGLSESAELEQEQSSFPMACSSPSQEDVLTGFGLWILAQSQREDSANNSSVIPPCRPCVTLLILYPETLAMTLPLDELHIHCLLCSQCQAQCLAQHPQ